jgi:AraC-like DNA-binding protein
VADEQTTGGQPEVQVPVSQEERQGQAFELRQLGYSIGQIATILGVSERTVMGDLQRVRQVAIQKIHPRRIYEVIIDGLLRFQILYQKGMKEYMEAPVGSLARCRGLEISLKANGMALKFLQDLGVVPQAPTTLALRLESEALRDLTSEERQRVVTGVRRFFELLGIQDVESIALEEVTRQEEEPSGESRDS